MTRTRVYREGVLQKEDFPLADVSDFLAESGTTVWVDLCAPSEADLADLADELGLHRLAVEDAVHEHQRPKLDRYDGHAFLTSYAVRFDGTTGRVATYELAAFVTPRCSNARIGCEARHISHSAMECPLWTANRDGPRPEGMVVTRTATFSRTGQWGRMAWGRRKGFEHRLGSARGHGRGWLLNRCRSA